MPPAHSLPKEKNTLITVVSKKPCSRAKEASFFTLFLVPLTDSCPSVLPLGYPVPGNPPLPLAQPSLHPLYAPPPSLYSRASDLIPLPQALHRQLLYRPLASVYQQDCEALKDESMLRSCQASGKAGHSLQQSHVFITRYE